MENKMEELAKLLGVELEEEFRIEGCSYTYKLSKEGLSFWAFNSQEWILSSIIGKLLTGERKIIKIPKPILNKKEKEYLSAVIKPFRDKVSLISKRSNDNGQFISIEIDEKPHNNNMFFPYFEEGSMYKGMEINKHYTLEELDL